MTEELGVALGAGVLAAVNPCGFALLPAYLSLLLLSDDPGRATALRRAVASSAAMTIGFVLVFGIFGLVISPIAAGVQRYLPGVTTVVGLVVVVAGGWLLAGRSLPTIGWSPSGPRPRRRLLSMVGFGATYALASLTCTIAPFLAIVVGTFRSGSVLTGISLFVAYAIGMGLLVTAAAIAVALARTAALTRLRNIGKIASRLAGGLLVVIGGYVAYYGWWELRVLAGAETDDPVIAAAAAAQQQLASMISNLGPAGLLVLLAALAVLGPLAARLRARHTSSAIR